MRGSDCNRWAALLSVTCALACGGGEKSGNGSSGGPGEGGRGALAGAGGSSGRTGGAGHPSAGGTSGRAGHAGAGTSTAGDSGDGGTGEVVPLSTPEPFYDSSHPYVQVMTPVPFVTYFAPATIRIWAHAPDYGSDSVNGYSPAVDFYVGSQKVGGVTATMDGPIDYYQVDATDVPAGSYDVYVKSLLASGTVESVHVPVTVVELPPSDGPSMELASDLVLGGSDDFELVGTPDARARLTSRNGSRIRSADGWTGSFVLRNADVIGLGSMDVPSIDVTVGGSHSLEISGSILDRCGPPSLTANDHAMVTIAGNTLQPNTLTPVNAEADYAGSHPSLTIAGDSDAQKLFQGNSVGVSFVRFDRSSHWLVGGDHDADGNVLIGVRAGIELDDSSDVVLRGNFSFHRYPFGWSQGHNIDFEGTNDTTLIEHNVFRASSWMIQGLGGELRYNLLIDDNEAFVRANQEGTAIHHNVFVNVGFQRQYYPSGGVTLSSGSFYNNTVDVGGKQLGWFDGSFVPAPTGDYQLTSARNNVFTGFAYENPTALFGAGSVAAADYNAFFDPDTTTLKPYADAGFGEHDVGGGADTDPGFAEPRVVPFPFGDGDIWLRRVTVSQILARYRAMYTPAAGSPLIDAGDPADDSDGTRSTDIGAIGAGNEHPDDRFGHFGP